MKSIMPRTLTFTVALVLLLALNTMAQRVLTGTVYREGKPAAGVTVEAHKSSDSFMTSFDGKYKIEASDKTKYIKFTFIDDARKYEIEGKEGDEFDFSFDGIIPTAEGEDEKDVILKTSQELMQARDKDFLNNFSMYDQFYKQKDFKSAIGPWRFIYRKYPKSSKNIYLHGVNLYQNLFEKNSDWDTKLKYADSIMLVYNRRIKYFDEKGFVKGRQGTDYLDLMRQYENWTDDDLIEIQKKGYGYLNESLEIQGKDAEPAVAILLMQTTAKLFKLGEFPKEKVVENFDKTSKAIDLALAENPNDENISLAKDVINQIFTVSGAADCEALKNLYEPKFDEIAKDIEQLKKMLRMLDRQECTEGDLFAKASEKLYELEPSPEAAYNMGRMFMKRQNFQKGKEYYLQAIDAESDTELLSRYYYELAYLVFAKENDYQKARDYARKSIANNGNNGKAYILLGDVYAAYSKNYGEKDFEHRSLYWLAVDYFNKAKRIDPETAVTVSERIKTYRPHFPDKETLFFEGFQDGQTYKIGSWINETTTVRSKK